MKERPQRPLGSRSPSTNNSAKSSPMSAEDKLKKSMRGLSYMGGSSGGSLNTSRSLDTKDKTERKKVGGVVLDLDTIQDAKKQKFDTKGRRNNVIILVLGLLLVISLVYLVIAIMGYLESKKAPNLRYNVEGDAKWVIEGDSKTKFLVRQGLGADMFYLIDSDLEITTTDSVTLTLEIEFKVDGVQTILPGLHQADENFIRVVNADESPTNKFVYQNTITGGGTIQVFDGFDFRDAPYNMNSSNIYLEITAIVTPV